MSEGAHRPPQAQQTRLADITPRNRRRFAVADSNAHRGAQPERRTRLGRTAAQGDGGRLPPRPIQSRGSSRSEARVVELAERWMMIPC